MPRHVTLDDVIYQKLYTYMYDGCLTVKPDRQAWWSSQKLLSPQTFKKFILKSFQPTTRGRFMYRVLVFFQIN